MRPQKRQNLKRSKEKKAKTFGVPDEKIAFLFLLLIHFFGALLLLFSKGGIYRITLDLVPVSIVLTFLISIKFQKDFPPGFFLFIVLGFLVGLLAEMVGTNLGWIFGSYIYGEVLGIKIWNTPVIIGINWISLAYGIGMLLQPLKFNRWIKWLAATFAMVLFDYFMEPVAIRHGFWEWNQGNIPLSNFLGWSLISGLICGAFFFFSFDKKNTLAAKAWLIQMGFFLIQNLF